MLVLQVKPLNEMYLHDVVNHFALKELLSIKEYIQGNSVQTSLETKSNNLLGELSYDGLSTSVIKWSAAKLSSIPLVLPLSEIRISFGGKRLLATSVQTFTILKCGASTKNLQLMNDKLPEWLQIIILLYFCMQFKIYSFGVQCS